MLVTSAQEVVELLQAAIHTPTEEKTD